MSNKPRTQKRTMPTFIPSDWNEDGKCAPLKQLTCWQFDIVTITVSAAVIWHNCQLFLSKEFLLLFQWKPRQPEKLCSVHKPQGPNTLLICLLGETSSLFWERQRLSSETTPPPPQPPLHRCRPPPPEKKIPLPSARCFNRGVLVNQSCQNINGSLRITFHASKTEPRVL